MREIVETGELQEAFLEASIHAVRAKYLSNEVAPEDADVLASDSSHLMGESRCASATLESHARILACRFFT